MEQKEHTEKPCPRCVQKGKLFPSPRAVSPSGNMYGYCRPCMNDYQKDRTAANVILAQHRDLTVEQLQDLPTDVKAQLMWALEILQPKTRGRPNLGNRCSKCHLNPRASTSPYCVECRRVYQKDRYERKKIEAAQNRASGDKVWEALIRDEQAFRSQGPIGPPTPPPRPN